jgi:methylated-DNA-[protein]-cysteine S-methyltransferase
VKEPKLRWTEDLEAASRAAADTVTGLARRRGLIDVAYSVVDSPVGRLFVASTRRGLVRLEFLDDRLDEILEELAVRSPPCWRTRGD